MLSATIITAGFGLIATKIIATPNSATIVRNTPREPNDSLNFAPSKMRPATSDECATIAVSTSDTGDVPNASPMPRAQIASALKLNETRNCVVTTTVSGSQDARCRPCALAAGIEPDSPRWFAGWSEGFDDTAGGPTLEPPRQAGDLPADEEQRPHHEDDQHIRQHQGNDGADAGFRVVLDGKRNDQRKVCVQRRNRVDRAVRLTIGR